MKKILAITLSILLVVGLMPSAFAADAVTISATDVTILEAEDYRDIFVVDDEGSESVVTIPDESICSDGTYLSSWSGNGWVRYEARDAESNSYASAYSLIEINVETAGLYTIEYYVRNSGTYSSTNYLLFDGQEYAVNKTSDEWGDFTKYYLTINLDAAIHAVGYKTTKAINNCYFAYDYIAIKPYTAVDVASEGVTKINGEDMKTLSGETSLVGKLASDDAADGGSYFSYDQDMNVGVATSTAKINVPETGKYKITAKLFWQVNYTGYTLTVDDTTIGTIASSTDDTKVDSWKTIGSVVELDEGEHTLTITSEGRHGHQDSYIDYVDIAPEAAPLNVAATGVAKAEAEDYLTFDRILVNSTDSTTTESSEVASVASDVNDSSIEYFSATEQFSGYTHTQTWNLPIYVEADGEYKISFRILNNNSYEGSLSTLLDETELEAIGEPNDGLWETYTYIEELTAGDHTVSVSSTHTNGNAHLKIDYVTVAEAYPTNPGAVDITEEKIFEAEDYRWITVVDAENVETEVYMPDSSIETEGSSYELAYSGDGWVRYDGAYGYTKAYSTIDINIPEDGIYEITYFVRNSGKNSSTNNLLINGESIYTMPTSSDNWNDFGTYTTSQMFKKGPHTLGCEANTASTGNGNCFFAYDYISIKPVVIENVSVAGRGVTTINALDYPYANAYNEDKTFVSLVQGQEPNGLAGQEAVRFVLADTDADVSLSDYVEWTVPLTVEVAGTYKATFSVAGGSGWYSSSKRAIVNGTEVGTAGGYWNALYTIEADVSLNKGSNEIGIRGYARGNDGIIDFEVMSVTLENAQPSNPKAVNITEETKFEAEDYRWITVVDAENVETEVYMPDSSIEADGSSYELTYSGDSWVRHDGYGNSKIYSTIDINIPEDGMYELTYYVRNSGKNSSTNNLLLDGESIYTMPTSSDNWNDFSTYTVTDTFTKGPHTLGYEANTASTGNKNCFFAYDYISIKPVVIENVSVAGRGVTTINATDYPYANAYNEDGTFVSLIQGQDPNGLAGQEAVRFVLADTDADVSSNDYVEWTVPLTVEVAGTYKATFSVAGGSGWYSSSKRAIVNGTEVGTAGGYWNALYTIEADVSLNKGSNEIGIRGYARGNDGIIDFEVMSVTLENAQPSNPKAVNITEETKFEAESYRWITVVDAEGNKEEVYTGIETSETSDALSDYSGDAWVRYDGYGNSKVYSTIDIEIPEDGMYELTYYVRNSGKNSSTNDLLVDGLSIYTMPVSSDDWGDFGTYTTKHLFTKGAHTIGYEANTASTGNKNCFFAYDYISIKPIAPIAVSGSGITTINASDYPCALAYNDDKSYVGRVPTDASAVEGTIRFLLSDVDSDVSTGDYAEWVVPVTVDATATYTATFNVAGGSGWYSSSKRAIVNGTEVGTAGGYWNTLYTITADVTLNAGVNKIGVRGYARGNDGIIDFEIKSVTLESKQPANPDAVEITGETKFEAEDYRWITVVDSEGAASEIYVTDANIEAEGSSYELAYSGDGWLRYDGYGNSKIYSTIDINIPTDGTYELTYFVRNTGNNSSTNNLLIDGTSVYTIPASSDDWNDFGLHTVKHLFTKGAHTIGYEAITASTGNKNCFYAYDYISIKPANDAVTVTPTEVTTLKASDYMSALAYDADGTLVGKATATAKTFDGKDAVQFGFGDTDGDKATDDYIEWIVPINVEEEGMYNVTFSIQGGSSAYVNTKKALVNGTEVGTAGGSNSALTTIVKYAYLKTGANSVGIRVYSRSADGGFDVTIDGITIEKNKAKEYETVTISKDSVTYIEAEDYNTFKTVSDGYEVYGTVPSDTFVSYEGAHGTGDANCIRWNAYGYEYVSFDIPITVTTSGMYKIDFNSGGSASYTGTQELYLDGELFVEAMKFSNSQADEFVNTYDYDKYLEAGSYTLTIKSTKTTANPNCYYYTDYVSFKPVSYIEESATAGTYDVTVVYDEPVSGIIAAAAYNKDNKLLTMTKVDVTNAERHSFQLTDVPTDEALRVIKIFAWDTECNPQDVRQDIFYNPVDTDPFAGDDEINIVYIGGSLTQGSGSTFGGWAGLASEYFKEKYGADKVVNHNVGIGGTTSQYGMFRLAQDVVSKNPDMVFIEFVLNDGGNNAARGASMETMVRTLLEMDKVPYVNFVYTKHKGPGYIVPHYHTQVARHYGIPEIYVKDSYVDEETENTRYPVTDSVHPNDAGYRAWYAEIEKCLVTDKYYQRPIQQNEAVFDASGILMASALDKFTFEKSGNWTEDTANNRLISSTAGNSVSFSFTGNSIGFVISGNSTYGNYSVTIDGVNKGTFSGTEVGWDQMNHFFTDLGDGEHDVTITVVDRVSIDEGTGETTVLGSYFCIEDIFVGDLIG